MTTHQRRHFSPEQKMAILRRHLLEHVPVSDLCDEYGLQPTVFYAWQNSSSRVALLCSSAQPIAPACS